MSSFQPSIQVTTDPEVLQRLMLSAARGEGPMQELLGRRNMSLMLQGDYSMPMLAAAARDGRSRKLRAAARQHRVPNFDSCPRPLPRAAQIVLQTINPVVALKFEQGSSWEGCDFICTEVGAVNETDASVWVRPEVRVAHLKALDAYGCTTPQAAVQTAFEALRISPLCPEAYNVLAVSQAATYEEALMLYRKAQELGPQVVQPQCLARAMGEMWEFAPCRPYYRAMYGVANTLRKMGRYEESLAAYDKLLAADGHWHSWASHVNVLALYPYVLLGAKGPKAVLDYMRSCPHTRDQFLYISSNVYWMGAYVLATLLVTEAKGKSVRAEGAPLTADDGWAADGLDLVKSTPHHINSYNSAKARPLSCFVDAFGDCVDMLLGDKALSQQPAPSVTGDEASAASLVYTTGSQWRTNPTVLERLRRYRNTFEVRALVQDMRCGLQVDIREVQHYMTAPGGFHTHALERDYGGTNVSSLMINLVRPRGPDTSRPFTTNELKVLKWLLDAGVPVEVTNHPDEPMDSPLQLACYQGYGPEAVQLLLAAGADPLTTNKYGYNALLMAAEQGNWQELQAILEALPYLKTSKAGDVFPAASPTDSCLLLPEALLRIKSHPLHEGG